MYAHEYLRIKLNWKLFFNFIKTLQHIFIDNYQIHM